MAELHRRNPSYHLHIAGKVQDASLEQYMRHIVQTLGLDSVVHFEGWQEDIQTWLADKNYIICTSVIESQGMGILEAMAGGIKPVIHNFPGAQDTFGSEWLFTTPQEFCDQILAGEYQSSRYRAFVENRYSLSTQLDRISQILLGMENRVSSLKNVIFND
jgi:glycosyltransferase involved in cell wall biosynthesis